VSGSLEPKLSALCEFSSLPLFSSEEEIAEEAMQKAVRRFGLRRFALLTGPKGDRKLVASHGFKNPQEVQEGLRQRAPHQFYAVIGEEGELGELFMEGSHPIGKEERKVCEFFAQQLERSLLASRIIGEYKQALRKLKKRELRFRALVEQSLVGVYIVSLDRIFYANEALGRIFGYHPEELVDRLGPLDLVHPEDRLLVAEELRRRLEGEAEYARYSFRGLQKDGSVISCEVFGRAIELEGRRVVLGTLIDITERRRSEEILRESEERFRQLVEEIEDVIYMIDERGVITYISPPVERLGGYRPSELMGRPFTEFVHPEDADRAREVLRSGLLGRVEQHEFRVFTKSGDIRWIQIVSRPIVEGDRIVGFRGMLRDVTERKRMEEAILRAKREWESTFDTIEELIFLTDADGKIRRVNKTTARKLKSEPQDLIGKKCREVFSCGMAGTDRCPLERVRKKKPLRPFECEASALGIWIRARAYAAYTSSGELDYVVHILRDITEERRSQEALARYREALNRSFFGTAEAFAKLVEERDPYTSGHSLGVARLAVAIAREMGLSEREKTGIYISGILHDIGKIAIPVEILVKPGRLTELERALIRTHPEAGYEVLKEIEFPWPVALATLQHHERMDGSGYPQGLKGEEIITEARILAVADVVDAMTHHRPYRPALPMEEALKELKRGKGRLYDPRVVDACLKVVT